MSECSGIVFDIQRAAMHDGPGIRTTAFLKGCPLRCAWCHNPEAFTLTPQTIQTPAGPKTYGRHMTVAEVMAEVDCDAAYYAASGGGLTLSGGEPTVQFEFCHALLTAAKARGYHTCLDTSGYCAADKFEQLRPLVDLFLFDYKATGAAMHKRLTGVPNRLILENLERLCAAGAQVVLRCPLVPGCNDMPEHFAALGDLSRQFGGQLRVEVLPYHRAGGTKYEALGLNNPCSEFQPPDNAMLERWRLLMRQHGLHRASIAGEPVWAKAAGSGIVSRGG